MKRTELKEDKNEIGSRKIREDLRAVKILKSYEKV